MTNLPQMTMNFDFSFEKRYYACFFDFILLNDLESNYLLTGLFPCYVNAPKPTGTEMLADIEIFCAPFFGSIAICQPIEKCKGCVFVDIQTYRVRIEYAQYPGQLVPLPR